MGFQEKGTWGFKKRVRGGFFEKGTWGFLKKKKVRGFFFFKKKKKYVGF